LVVGRNDQPACGNELPLADRLRDELELLSPQIIEACFRLRRAATQRPSKKAVLSELAPIVFGSAKLSKIGHHDAFITFDKSGAANCRRRRCKQRDENISNPAKS
jgi:hypothetical protein